MDGAGGGLEVPADCPMLMKEHPRLRQRLKHPKIAKELERAKQIVSRGRASTVLLGVLWQLTGDRKYAEAGEKKLHPTWIQTYALAVDLLMDSMSRKEADSEAGRIVKVIQNNRWRPHLVLAICAWGHGYDDYLATNLKRRYEEELLRAVRYNNQWSRGRGGSSMSYAYYGEHFYTDILLRFTLA